MKSKVARCNLQLQIVRDYNNSNTEKKLEHSKPDLVIIIIIIIIIIIMSLLNQKQQTCNFTIYE